jgi:hypothetical protein
MKQNQKILWHFSFLIFFTIFMVRCGSDGNSHGMISKKYPDGFSLKHPKSWGARVEKEKHIIISDPSAEQDPSFVLVYPFFLEKNSSSRNWLGKNLEKFSEYFNKVSLEKIEQVRSFPDETAVRFYFERRAVPCRGLALCSIHERSGILYVMGSQAEDFDERKIQLLQIIRSFRFEAPEKGREATPEKTITRYVQWRDPTENAFSLEVPENWPIQGGTYRRASVDLVHFLQASSPDRRIQIQFNDSNIPVFAIPNQMMNFAGFTEGSWYSPGYGVRMLVKRYTPGLYFMLWYLQQNISSRYQDFRIESQKDRPDAVADFNRIYSQFASFGMAFTLHAGEVAFRFKQDSIPFVGYGFALTQLVQLADMQGGNWSVPLLVIYICPLDEAETVRSISDHMFKSVRINPQWAASQQQLAGNVSQIVTQTSREISRIIDESYWNRQAVLDDVHRRISNNILGVMDVVDPETGEKWKVEAGHNYYWRKDYTNQVVGTQQAERPDIDFSILKEF